MPLFSVEWVFRDEWIVEAPTREKAMEAAMFISRHKFELDGPDICIDRIHRPYESKCTVDAVVIEGKLMHPNDAENHRRQQAFEMILDEVDRLVCPKCELVSSTESWVVRSESSSAVEFICQDCYYVLKLDDCRCIAFAELAKFDLDPNQRELFRNEEI